MKYLLILCLCTGLAYGQQNEEQQIKALLNQQAVDWNKGNIEAYMQGYWHSDSLVFIGKNGPKYGWQTTLANYQKGYPDKAAMGLLSFEFIKIESTGASAFVIGKWDLKREKDNPGGYFTLYLKKINGKWLIVADHSS